MTYTNKSIREVSPFDVGKITGTTNATFNTFNVDWLSLNGNNIISNDNASFYSEANFSPDNNSYGIARIVYDGNSTNLHLMGQNMPESSNTGAGARVRSDDVAIHYSNTHWPKYDNNASISLSQDISRANLKIIRADI